jgi:hypothetical protein
MNTRELAWTRSGPLQVGDDGYDSGVFGLDAIIDWTVAQDAITGWDFQATLFVLACLFQGRLTVVFLVVLIPALNCTARYASGVIMGVLCACPHRIRLLVKACVNICFYGVLCVLAK